jgi:RHS repeat-associated protein
VAYMLQDGNYNVVGLVDHNGALIARYVWDPYGSLLAVNIQGSPQHPNRIGHQGLFFDRFDARPYLAQLTVGAKGLYQNRNRVYNPALGRFMQRDPNGSGVPVLAVMAMQGGAIAASSLGFDADAMYGDGMSLHVYVASNPANRTDPGGLFLYPAQLVDSAAQAQLRAQETKRVGSAKAAILGALQGYFNWGGGTTAGLATWAVMHGSHAVSQNAGRWWYGDPSYVHFAANAANANYTGSWGGDSGWGNRPAPPGAGDSDFRGFYKRLSDWPLYDPRFEIASRTRDKVHWEKLEHLRKECGPGKWVKEYLYGRDGREIHLFRNLDNQGVAYPKWVP